jgi:5-(carboxyamino)imidazole ribonucleotide synthase
MILPGATLGLLGGGQLGRMFTMAARTLDYKVLVLDPDRASPAADLANEHLCADYRDRQALERLARECAAITTEFENPPAESLHWLAEHSLVRPSGDSVAIAQDRIREKTFLAGNGFAVAPFAVVRDAADLETACQEVPLPGLLKVSRLGYDGKGQARIASLGEAQAQFSAWGGVPCVLEQLLPLKLELSVVLARGADGEAACFPAAENAHQGGILDVSIVPARADAALTLRAAEVAGAIAQKLDYCGVLAVEFFVLSDGNLVVNELAPRPHNSGHYTLDACLSSQFEQQVRTLCGLPLGDARLVAPAVMVNLLGEVWRGAVPDWSKVLRHHNVKLHLYGKREARPGRKMGHYTVLADSVEAALELALAIKRDLRSPD